ncbi:hypothetical protein GVN24_34850 [Rhizobium sp. CRIBSB]|nr:hypothetical protein [Rhizobium sp. CRIBSB]
MSAPIHPTENDDALAAELALRVLTPEAEAAARAREAADPEFAAAVDGWNARLAALADEVEPVEPSEQIWPRIDAGVGHAATRPAANDNDRLVFWRRWAVGSTGLLAASVASLIVLAAQPKSEPAPVTAPAPAVTRVATLALGGDGAAAMTLVYDSKTGALYLAPTDKMAGDTRVPHLWLVMPEGGVQLVGAIDGGGVSTHNLKGEMPGLAGRAVAVAVSMEQPGHTPGIHKPDGPVVASGEMQKL